MVLSELLTPVSSLNGVGPKAAASYEALGVSTLGDLVSFSPRGYEDRSSRVCIGRQNPDSGLLTNTIVEVESVQEFGAGRKNIKARVRDTENGVHCWIMGFNRPYLKKILYSGSFYRLYGNVVPYGTILQCSQFELTYVQDPDMASVEGGILPVYQVAGTLSQKQIRRDVKAALAQCRDIEDDIPSSVMAKYSLMDVGQAFREIHFPTSDRTLQLARRTLAFREVFYLQLGQLRHPSSSVRKRSSQAVTSLEKTFVSSLPFQLTSDQVKVLEEIRSDMASGDSAMNRLLQGDVGSGKTLVAWISALHVIAQGGQVAFMAPTELLARQHAQGAAKLLSPLGINVAYLDGQVHGKSRTLLLKQLSSGNVDIIIGTHALFSKDVDFRDLRYVIIDEQHRFGVRQRASLFEKGIDPDVLLMTATPIPRTLALTVFGNLNVSTIKTMPAGRRPIVTYLVDSSKRQSMYDSIRVELQRGHKAYFVYPRIEASEDDDPAGPALRDAEGMFDYLSREVYPSFKGAVVHSRLPEEEKLRALDDFASGKLDFLVSTSVVEVGIDVPDATCMVIEHADFFGLSALHQLRGRVGRSALQSWCFLVFESGISDDGKKRLSALHRTTDGFEIAEEDLKLRGPGELSGMRQSGFLKLKYASLEKDVAMMAAARDEVQALLDDDPGLISLGNSCVRRTLATLQQASQRG